jgi:hypothetical protein
LRSTIARRAVFTLGDIMRFGFTKEGCFVLVDDVRRIGEFAYASSPYAEAARRDDYKTANLMLARTWLACPDSIREAHYLMSCEQLAQIESAKMAG